MPQISYDAGTDGYRPGVCNIGPAEIARRRRAGYLGLAVAAALAVALLASGAPPLLRLLVGLPLAGGAVGLLQARLGFCAAFGMAGVRNFGALGRVESVEVSGARRADRTKALAIFLAASAIGFAGAALLVLLPG